MLTTETGDGAAEKQGGSEGVEVRRQASLLKTGALQDAIFNSANFSSIATDEKGVIQIFNVGAERMLGYAALDVVNRITPADISDPQELIARATSLSLELDAAITPGFEALVFKASRGIEDIYELTYIRKDGSRFPAIVSVTALRDVQEKIIGYLLIGTDNTARKQAEEALLKAGALQNAIFSSANFSSIATDERGVIQIFNVGAERMLGYAALDVVNQITPADISDPQELIARADDLSLELDTKITPGFEALVFKASRGIEDIYELTYIRKDGSRFPAIVSVTALRDAHENIIGYLLIGTDNTARKQIEEARALLDQRLRDQQFYTRSLIESNIDALMTTNPQGIISDVNEQMIALTGRTRDELIGAPCKNFFTDPAQADAAIKRVLVENKVRNYELTVRALNGEETVVSYNAATFHDRDRNLQGVFAAARDVTEHKRFERTLQEKNIELEHASRMKSAFLATMSHELRTPLNAIIGFSEALQEGLVGKVSETQREYIGDIFTSGQHLLSLINDILDLSKVEAGRLEIERAPLAIADVIENTCGMLDQLAVKNGVDFTLFMDPAIPAMVLGDALRLRQVLLNLVSNAIKFSSGRALPGRVAVRTRLVERSAGQVMVDIDVSDNGIGMDEATKVLLFTAFSQADASTTRRFGGTGLGLAISRHLLDLMDGRVTLESAIGEGSTFSVRLCCALPQDVSMQDVPMQEVSIQVRLASEVAGLTCIVAGRPDGVADDIAAYLAHDGAHVERCADLTAAAALLRTAGDARDGSWVCILDAADAAAPLEALRALAHDFPERPPGLVCLERGSHRRPYEKYENVVLLDCNVLLRQRLGRSVAMAAGRMQAPSQSRASAAGMQDVSHAPPSQADALRDGRLILVAEDNETNQKVIVRQLALLGFVAHVAANGKLALEYLQRHHYGLLLTDLHMPEMDGYELAAAIRAREFGAHHLPIVALTASALAGEAERCRAAGMDDYLCKPLQLMDLKAAVEAWLPGTTASLQLQNTVADREGGDDNGSSKGRRRTLLPALAPAVNVGILEALVGDDPAVIHDFLHHFQFCAGNIADALRNAHANRNGVQAAGQAHKLKASARTIGALALGARCTELELAGKSDNLDALTTLLPAFEREFSAVNVFLDALELQYEDRYKTGSE
jgi:PAS domain S-box-containing protein